MIKSIYNLMTCLFDPIYNICKFFTICVNRESRSRGRRPHKNTLNRKCF